MTGQLTRGFGKNKQSLVNNFPFEDKTLWHKVDDLITEYLGDDYGDDCDVRRTFVRDVVMDFILTNKDQHYVVDMLKGEIRNDHFNPIQFYGLLAAAEDLRND